MNDEGFVLTQKKLRQLLVGENWFVVLYHNLNWEKIF